MNLIYIVCPGHSGSTILDMLLGQHKDVFSTGELIHLPNQYHRNKLYEATAINGLSCSCGKGFYNCEFWGNFINELNKKIGFDIVKKPLSFKIGFLMRHSRPHQKIIHKIKRQLVFLILKYKLTLIDKVLLPFQRKKIKHNEILINLIHQQTNAKYIVDSTKDYFRLHYLMKSKINIKVIVLKRSILGVAASGKKQKSKPQKSAYHWMKYYSRLSTVLNYNKIEHLNVSYENIVDDTINELNRIYQFLGLEKLENFSGGLSPANYHIVAGNGLRNKNEIIIRKDDSWREILNEEEIKMINEMQKQ